MVIELLERPHPQTPKINRLAIKQRVICRLMFHLSFYLFLISIEDLVKAIQMTLEYC